MHNFKNKIVIFGESGVGKSSLLALLQGKDMLDKRSPTVGLEIETSVLDSVGKVSIWDLAGQDRFKLLWDDFFKGAGLTVLVTDSSEENVSKSKDIYERFSRFVGSKIIAIANKQDVPGRLTESEVQKRLGGITTYGMSAIRPELRERMRQILDYEIKNE